MPLSREVRSCGRTSRTASADNRAGADGGRDAHVHGSGTGVTTAVNEVGEDTVTLHVSRRVRTDAMQASGRWACIRVRPTGRSERVTRHGVAVGVLHQLATAPSSGDTTSMVSGVCTNRDRARGASLQLEDDSQGCIDVSKFVGAEVSDLLTEAGGVHGGGLLNQHTCGDSVEQNLRAEACGSGRCRGWRVAQG